VDESGLLSFLDIIPSWFSMLMYQLGDAKYARWWPQFRGVVSPHRNNHEQPMKHIKRERERDRRVASNTTFNREKR
jgi:hypothetical protein